jgi:hypothetical protein
LLPGRGGQGRISLADVDDDARLDLIVSNFESQDISIFIADGAGGFLPDERYAAGSRPVRFAIGDVDGDDEPDILVANDIVNAPEIGGSLVLLRNQR